MAAFGLSTRHGKEAVDAAALVADWRRRAVAVGVDIDGCFHRHRDLPIIRETLAERDVDTLFTDLADPLTGLCSAAATFDRGDVLKAIADWAITAEGRTRKVLLPPGEIERLADSFCASPLVVQLDPAATTGTIRRQDGTTVNDGQHKPVYATVELLEVEAEIVARYRNGRHTATGQVADGAVNTAAIDGIELSDEQRALVHAWCTSGHRVQTAVGRGHRQDHHHARRGDTVAHGRLPRHRMRRQSRSRPPARRRRRNRSRHRRLAVGPHRAGQHVLDHRTVLIVDEASTIGDRDLLALLRIAEATGATVRLIGDTAQHGSVPAGGSFAQLVAFGGDDTPELKEVRRLRDPAERRRAELVRSGNVSRALDELVTSGQLVLTDSDADTYAAMLGRWYEHRQAGETHPIVHGRNRQRRLLNQLAQTVLVADGTVDIEQSVTTRDGRRLGLGDDVVARHGDRSIHPPGDRSAWMRNGTTGRVVAVHRGQDPDDDRITVRTDGGLIDCGRGVFDRRRGGLDHGYAVTSYAVQGSTRNASTSAVTATTARSELYVDITRGRDSNQLYATRITTDGDSEAHLPRLDGELIPTLHRHLARGTVRTALALDPDALAIGRVGRGRTLLALLAAQQRGEAGPIDQAIQRRIAALRRQARSSPPDALRNLLPSRPRCPHLAERWDHTAGDVAVHLASTSTPRRRDQQLRPMERVLGQRSVDPAESGAGTSSRVGSSASPPTSPNGNSTRSPSPKAADPACSPGSADTSNASPAPATSPLTPTGRAWRDSSTTSNPGGASTTSTVPTARSSGRDHAIRSNEHSSMDSVDDSNEETQPVTDAASFDSWQPRSSRRFYAAEFEAMTPAEQDAVFAPTVVTDLERTAEFVSRVRSPSEPPPSGLHRRGEWLTPRRTGTARRQQRSICPRQRDPRAFRCVWRLKVTEHQHGRETGTLRVIDVDRPTSC